MADVYFLALDDRLASVAVGSPFTTEQGVGVGVTKGEIVDTYGEDNVEEHTNRFQIDELLVTPPDSEPSELGILFRMIPGGDKVEFIEAGTLEALSLDEGCA